VHVTAAVGGALAIDADATTLATAAADRGLADAVAAAAAEPAAGAEQRQVRCHLLRLLLQVPGGVCTAGWWHIRRLRRLCRVRRLHCVASAAAVAAAAGGLADAVAAAAHGDAVSSAAVADAAASRGVAITPAARGIAVAAVHDAIGFAVGGALQGLVQSQGVQRRNFVGGCGRWVSHLWLRRMSWVRFVHDARAIAGPRARGRTVAAAAFSLTIGLAVAVADAAVRSGGAVSASGV